MSKVLKSMWLVLATAMAFTATAASELSIAREALRDGLWEVARKHAGTDASDEAKLVILESYAGEGRWDEIGKALSRWKGAKGDGFDYYRAVVRGDHAAAMEILKRVDSSAGLFEAKLYEAETLTRDGNREAASVLWREIVAATNVSERAFVQAAANLMDATVLRKAYAMVKSAARRRMVGLRLGTALLGDASTAQEGEKLIRAIVRDSPDAEGAREAFLAMADAEVGAKDWSRADATYHTAIETWPDVAKIASVQEGRGWILANLGRKEEALQAFRQARELAKDDEMRAVALVKEGDVLQSLGRAEESMTRYREVLEKYPKSRAAVGLAEIVAVRDAEAKGLAAYRTFHYEEAIRLLSEVAAADPARQCRMQFFVSLCEYGRGRDDAAERRIRQLLTNCPDKSVQAEATLWLAKFLFNRREWKESGRLFSAAAGQMDGNRSAEAFLWAARAALADGDFPLTIALTTRVAENVGANLKAKLQALLVQGEALIELARYDEAVLVLDRVATAETAQGDERTRAQLLRADALFAMGADNAVQYAAALDAYRSVRLAGALSPSEQIVVSFKLARTLEKMKRRDEAVDQYYSQVVLAYREGCRNGMRFTDEARATFSRAAFWLADEHESRGRDYQALRVLELVVASDVPAANEAAKRIARIENKGNFL